MSNAPYLGLRYHNNIIKEWRALFLQVKRSRGRRCAGLLGSSLGKPGRHAATARIAALASFLCSTITFYCDMRKSFPEHTDEKLTKIAVHLPYSCVCLSVTSRWSTETAKRRVTQTTPHYSPGSQGLYSFPLLGKTQTGSPLTPNGGAKVIIGDLRQL